MYFLDGLIMRIILISISLFCTQFTFAKSSIDYNSVNLSALQNQYQKQLKPKARKKVVPKTTKKRKQIQSKELLQYKRLLAGQQPQQKKQVQRPTYRPIRAIPRPAQARAQGQLLAAPRVAPIPRRDALFEAASSGNVRLIGQLLSKGVNVNQANRERETALHMAAAKGHYSAVIYLLNHGANIHSRTINNWLPIHHATRFRHAHIANYLKQRGSQIYARTSDGLSAVDMAKALNDRRILGIFGVR